MLAVVVAIGAGILLGVAVFSGGHERPVPAKELRSRLQAIVAGPVPGALLFVRRDNRSTVLTAGVADEATKKPLAADDTFRIGSTTKTYTAVLVMRLVARGDLALDATVETYLPGLLRYGRAITVRQLLNHTSGLPDFADQQPFLAPYERGDLRHTWTPAQMIAFVAHKNLHFTPGSQFEYSNTNYVVLALLAESIDGESYTHQLDRYIFKPLALVHTAAPTTAARSPDIHGYAPIGPAGLGSYGNGTAGARLVDTARMTPAAAWAAGGIQATALDEADFLRGLFSGKLLPRAQVAAMEDTSEAGGAYGLGLMDTGGFVDPWQSATRSITKSCDRAWGHGGAFPGYYQLAISSPDGTRQAILLVNADETLLTPAKTQQIYDLLATAYCRGAVS